MNPLREYLERTYKGDEQPAPKHDSTHRIQKKRSERRTTHLFRLKSSNDSSQATRGQNAGARATSVGSDDAAEDFAPEDAFKIALDSFPGESFKTAPGSTPEPTPKITPNDNASDTEEEDMSAMEEFYLKKMNERDIVNDTFKVDNTAMETYYLRKLEEKIRAGKGMSKGRRVWESFSGAGFARRERKARNQQTSSRRQRKTVESNDVHSLDDMQSKNSAADTQGHLTSTTPTTSTATSPPLSSAPQVPNTLLVGVQEYRNRNPANGSTIFHHRSAVLNPLGALARPFPHPHLQPAQPSSPTPRRVTSGSFGTFEAPSSRFDQRTYRLPPHGTHESGRQPETKPKDDKAPHAWLHK